MKALQIVDPQLNMPINLMVNTSSQFREAINGYYRKPRLIFGIEASRKVYQS